MENNISITIVDDDKEIRTLLTSFLIKHGYKVTAASSGEELLKLIEQKLLTDLIVLDVMMPGIDGIEVCKRIRKTSSVPIIMLTAVSDEADRIVGLELGADDYLAKPFNPRELLARIKAILRRSKEFTPAQNHSLSRDVLEFLGWKLDTATRRLFSPDEVEIPLSTGTYNLLLAFVQHPQHILSRDQLMDMTKSRLADPFDRSIDVQISRLRQKIEVDAKNPQIIKTVRSGGYLFTAAVNKHKKITL